MFQFDQWVLGAAYVTPGVVFNEMKGVYSNPDAAHGRTANQSMFPDNQPLGVLESMGEGESFSMGRCMAQYAAAVRNSEFHRQVRTHHDLLVFFHQDMGS